MPPCDEARSARLSSPLRRPVPGCGGPVPSSVTTTASLPSRTTTSTVALVAPACRATFDSDSRTTATRSSPASGGTATSGPDVCSRGRKPRASRAEAISSCSASRRSAGPLRSRSRKMALRTSLIEASRSSTTPSSRSASAGGRSWRATDCTLSPTANRRCTTRSCRSRAIRSRSSSTASRARSCCAAATSRASATWSANEAFMLQVEGVRRGLRRPAQHERAVRPSAGLQRQGHRAVEPGQVGGDERARWADASRASAAISSAPSRARRPPAAPRRRPTPPARPGRSRAPGRRRRR